MRKKFFTLLAISIVLAITILTHYLGWLKPVESFFRYIVNPGSKAMYALSVKINNTEEEFTTSEDLLEAYKKIKDEWLKNKINEVELETLRQDNENLRQELNFIKTKNYDSIGIEVIGKNIDPTESTLIINRGSKDGVREGSPVVVGNGILVGKIAKVEEKISVVRLLDDNQSKVAATVINYEKSVGLIEGGYGISVQMNFIPQSESIGVGDIVVTSGLEEKMPRGLLVGAVQAVEKEAHQPFQKAVIKPFAKFDKVTIASVLINVE
ncbi:MAG: rod shape-determining protein MreC [Candidatus Magasanikbacteria bacterium RIFCSPLOWO2_01_FULL_43_20b]|uniref:Cell shape-determining protein MreC n=1 Tax=Candidatus Magasanikbacteria bacterium RIFCSPLOWO2_12_FULL_43_12 TaxID=1798692 RepID=A0A1F6MR20_9BACT|nr:MAG: rod shape-determining protein MreC [Candidatus Magasanikbacteria bacterium RIFCSPHIGHO2_02_FULL_44_13]OGH72530.1 MAG: rod shape-determining protein MreC [Candidatus Magasanikbacteria bacterium RIFCSPLOWO2_02_FULL_43_22]OGH73701.1 MAG: rod shape-determining protein MreC [Candidatus Magasanikbacteria bacterium RIFCSPLOWO2_01_FULL_43_20b]OGH74115.1 MAG: rod shape-determining protein MreC [Candidatus Magasanikbacteria bacterium RIFCSPLOWO2_12_FULL_43_12]